MNEGMLKETHILFLERWGINDDQRNEQCSQFIPGAACIAVKWTGGLDWSLNIWVQDP